MKDIVPSFLMALKKLYNWWAFNYGWFYSMKGLSEENGFSCEIVIRYNT